MEQRLRTMQLPIIICLVILTFSSNLISQTGKVQGLITNDTGEPLVGATINIVGGITDNINIKGVSTNEYGQYSLALPSGTFLLEASYVGYDPKRNSITIYEGQVTTLNFILEEGFTLDELVVIGTRTSNRTDTETPVPVDLINIEEMVEIAPQSNLNQVMHFFAPSFSSNTQVISDGTDHIDPASLRGLGPDQVLVLINGKRRHNTSMVNVNGTFGRGNVGTDLNAIPLNAVKRVEVLRDGAAAQYGSDAIAGVINIQLKEDIKKLRFTLSSGANFTKNTSPEKNIDGETYEITTNFGLPIGQKGGFINLTGSFNYRGWTNRMQEFTGEIFNRYNAIERVGIQDGIDISNLSIEDIQQYSQEVSYFLPSLKSQIANTSNIDSLRNILATDVTEEELRVRRQTREDFIMRVGQSRIRGGNFFTNMTVPLGEEGEFYAFGGLSYREGNSGCFYRLPNQSRTYTPAFPNGHIPEINSQIGDKSMSLGIRGNLKNWDIDFSNTIGQNTFNFIISETANASMQNTSPSTFNAGSHLFLQNTSNLDLSQYFHLDENQGVNIAFGSEYRFENFRILPGNEQSYGNYDINGNLINSLTPNEWVTTDFFNRTRPAGAQCFSGFLPANEVNARRSSSSLYIDSEWDFDRSLLISGALRFENYSDFGSTFNYKLASRYKINEQLTIRLANSTGFRAPSLHQIHFSRTSTIFVTEDGKTNAQEVGIFSNTSRAANLLGIPQLREERSQNFSLGFTTKLVDWNIKATIDAYWVNIKDRIVLTGQFQPNGNSELENIFSQVQATRAAFFANAIDTRSRGLDIVLSHKLYIGRNANFTNNLAATFSGTRALRDNNGNVIIKTSQLLKNAGLETTYFDETNQQYLEKATPRTKITIGNSYSTNNLQVYLRNTYFGATEEAANISELDASVNYIYRGKIITDISIAYQPGNDLKVIVGANNLLDIYPDETDESFSSDGRFVYSRRSPQFSYGGRYLFARLIFQL